MLGRENGHTSSPDHFPIHNLTYTHIHASTTICPCVYTHTCACTYTHSERPFCDLPGEQPSPRLRVSVPAPEPGGGVLLLWDPGCPLGERSTWGLFCVVKWDPPYQWLQWGLGAGWKNQSVKVVFISCLISCRLSSAFRSILSLPGFSGEGGTRGTQMHSSTPSYLWGGRAEAREAAAAVSVASRSFLWWGYRGG